MTQLRDEGMNYAEMFDLGTPNGALFCLFGALRQAAPLGLKGQPMSWTNAQVTAALNQATEWPGFFDVQDLEKALSDDFLDAARGSTDNRQGWKVRVWSVAC